MATDTIEQRMTRIESQQEATNKRMDDFREDITGLRSDVTGLFSEMNTGFRELRSEMNTGFKELRTRINHLFYITLGWPAAIVAALIADRFVGN